ncbi:MAG: glycosyltransferase [Labilithrix sp.]|nr:glycosyltransferase [Labilithrix sp.]MCW5810324.1 glycosyltransferase [Labilithrix sp.]
MRTSVVVVPCYNERARLSRRLIEELATGPRVLLVDDGSTDDTATMLRALAAEIDGVECLIQPVNAGKAEAVRAGMQLAIDNGAQLVGYADADFATGPTEIKRLCDELLRSKLDVVLGSRVRRMGAIIDRSPIRHVAGRVFATMASVTLGLPVYDTQCGAKWFRATPRLVRALEEPFTTRWAFDVELLGRLLQEDGSEPLRILELPLVRWQDVGGSKLSVVGMLRVFGEGGLLMVRSFQLRSRRRWDPGTVTIASASAESVDSPSP